MDANDESGRQEVSVAMEGSDCYQVAIHKRIHITSGTVGVSEITEIGVKFNESDLVHDRKLDSTFRLFTREYKR